MKHFFLIVALTITHILLANELTTDLNSELIDCFWGLSSNQKLLRNVTIGGESFYIDKKNEVGEFKLVDFTQPVLNIRPVPRFYGKKPSIYYIKTPQGWKDGDPRYLSEGTLLYVRSAESEYKLAAYVSKNHNSQSIDNQEINAIIIRQALEAPSLHITDLPQEIMIHLFGFLSLKDIYHLLLTHKNQLRPAVEEALKDRLKDLQKQKPLKVTPTMLPGLLPYQEYITRIKLTNSILRGEKPDVQNIIRDDSLKKLGLFTSLREFILCIGTEDRVTEAGLLCLSQNLEALSLKGNFEATDNLFLGIADRYTKLRTIRLAENINESQFLNRITTEGLQAILDRCPHLTSLFLPRCIYIGEQRIRCIADKCAQLQYLGITGNTLKDEDITYLVNQCKDLRHLGLKRASAITKNGLQAIATHSPKLRYLNLDKDIFIDDNAIINLVTQCHELESLSLNHLNLTDASLTAIGTHCPKLQRLELDGNKSITDAGIVQLVTGCHEIRRLGLGNVKIRDMSLQTIAMHCPKLEHLNLKGNKLITDAGVIPLVTQLHNLKYLELSESNIGNDSLKAIADNCPRLRYLGLYRCPNLTRDGIKYLSELENLKTLWIHVKEMRGRKEVEKFLKNPFNPMLFLVGPFDPTLISP